MPRVKKTQEKKECPCPPTKKCTKQKGGDNDHETKTTKKKLSSPLDIVEFYCLTCKNKRKLRGVSDITITTAKNGRKVAYSYCNKKKDPKCTRKLVKFLSNEQANHLNSIKKTRKPHQDI